MAKRRMLSTQIIDSDAFLDLGMSSQNLYFHLCMRADDDGFLNNPKRIMRMIGASEDDLKLLLIKKFIIAFESGVVVIKHWRIHNYIQADRYTETVYTEEKNQLSIDQKNIYHFSDESGIVINKGKKPLTSAQQKRLEAKKESNLPYSFEYKIRQAFIGDECPICHTIMRSDSDFCKPSIQHNIPISLGGKHEIDNISVICLSCNNSIQNREITKPLNTDKVRAVWECIGNGVGMDTQYRLDKIREDKNRLVESVDIEQSSHPTPSRMKKPELEEIRAYFLEIGGTEEEATHFFDYYTSNGWKISGKAPMKDWKSAVRNWHRNETKFNKGKYPQKKQDALSEAMNELYGGMYE